jgi:oxygen-independent coproporphyrinogen-3 oxidase
MDALGPLPRVETVFVGGGTPSILPPDDLASLLAIFSGMAPREWTVEANPETVSHDFLETCATAGVNRLSIGIQSLHDTHLRLLKRSATRASTLRGAALAAREWKGELNLDFIAGIPGQTPAEVLEDLRLLDDVGAGHVSLYQLTSEPGTPLAVMVEAGSIRLDAPDRQEELWFTGRDELLRRGFRHYEISNFCKPGKECLHNLRYWSIDPYAGFGPGAVSTLPAAPLQGLLGEAGKGARPGDIVRITNPRDLESFARGRTALWGMEVEIVSPRDFLMETLMMGLRVDTGIECAAFERRFGFAPQALLPGLWERWVESEWAEPPEDRLALTPEGRMVLDHLMGMAVDALSENVARSLTVAWP